MSTGNAANWPMPSRVGKFIRLISNHGEPVFMRGDAVFGIRTVQDVSDGKGPISVVMTEGGEVHVKHRLIDILELLVAGVQDDE